MKKSTKFAIAAYMSAVGVVTVIVALAIHSYSVPPLTAVLWVGLLWLVIHLVAFWVHALNLSDKHL